MASEDKASAAELSPLRRYAAMVTLIVAGEAVFLLPFMIPRVFRPTLLEVLDLTNLEFGLAHAVYGVVAMVAYFFGGPLGDRFPARKMMAAALLGTAAGGLLFARAPSLLTLELIYASWGLTTILLFWSPLIKATREWGGQADSGLAFGLLEGGRGLVAAVLASGGVALFGALAGGAGGEALETLDADTRARALGAVILIVAGFTAAVALPVWWLIPEGSRDGAGEAEPGLSFVGVRAAARSPAVWLLALIVLCAYVGYKSIDDVALYARDAHGYTEVEAAQLGALTFWVRPVAALAAGVLADRMRGSTIVTACFAIMLVGNLALASGALSPGAGLVLILTFAWTCLGVFGLRGVYFALFDEAAFPISYTGSAVGLVSVLGYAPDVFMGPLMGALTEAAPEGNPGLGHQWLYGVIAAFALLGLLASWAFGRAQASTA